MEKRISVIIPCYNVSKYIDRCFKSIIDQTIGVDMLEVIMIDDASTDDTWDKLTEYEKNFPENVMIIHLDNNSRQGTARNIGLKYSSCDYVLFVDADDWIEPVMIERLYGEITDENVDFSMCYYGMDRGESKFSIDSVEPKHYLIDNDDKRRIFITCMSIGTSPCAKLYRKSFLTDNDIWFAEGISYEDHVFIALTYLYATKFSVIAECLYHYYVNTQSTVNQINSRRHYDIVESDKISWNECSNRGFVDKFRNELEYYFLQVGFLAPLRNVLNRFSEVPMDLFEMIKNETLIRVPDYKLNPYLDEYMTQINKILLGLLDTDVTLTELTQILDAVEKYTESVN